MRQLLDTFTDSIAKGETNNVLYHKLLADDIRLPTGKPFSFDMVVKTKAIIRNPSRFSGSKFGKFILSKGNK